jgi:hypothetical protein
MSSSGAGVVPARLLCAVPPNDTSAKEPLLDTSDDDAAATFYRHVLVTLSNGAVPFLLGGTFALCHYAKFVRFTKDLDVFIRERDVARAFEALEASGCWVEKPYPHWLAKVHRGELFADIIYNSGNGVAVVDEEWFEHASAGTALGVAVQICPAEETIWSKAYIMERERYDGADVAHLIRACGERLDWPRLLRRFGVHWRVLFSHLALFGFVYPAERDKIPPTVIYEMMERMRRETATKTAGDDQACAGTLLSREQYLVDVEQWGYRDARIDQGTMSKDELSRWTKAIERRPD